MLVSNRNLDKLKSTLEAAEHLSSLSATNLANVNTLGYKALQGEFVEECGCNESFRDILPRVAERFRRGAPSGSVKLEVKRDSSPGKTISINGQKYEASNVEPTEQLNNLVVSSAMIRTTLAAVQLENNNQREIINMARR